MATPAAWHVRRPAEGSGLVLACDFSAAGRPVATFTELAELLTTGCALWETAPPEPDEAVRMTGREHVARWAGDLRGRGPVRAVLGFCTGALYAGALAEEIARSQRRPRLILLDPEPARASMLTGFYESLITRRFASVLSPADAEAALREGRRAADDTTGGLTALADRLSALVREVVEPAFARVGLHGARVDEFVGLATSYLYWIAAADSCPARGPWATATALNGNTEGAGLRSFTAAERPGLLRRAVYLDVSHTDLMRSPETARLVDDLLTDDKES
ncbi:hypothetical protein [Streptomyces altiplanensis]